MSQSLNIIETSEIDRSRELDGIVPESTYYHSTGIIQRHHAKMSPYEAGLVNRGSDTDFSTKGSDASKGIQYNWQINATPNSVLNLNEMYFEVNGRLRVKCDFSKFASLGDDKTVTVKTEDLLIPSDLWFHSAFQNVQLRIGDAVISNVNNPIVYNIFRKLMFHGEEKDDLAGFAGSHYFRKSTSATGNVEHTDDASFKNTQAAELGIYVNGGNYSIKSAAAAGDTKVLDFKHQHGITGDLEVKADLYGLHQGLYNFANGGIENRELVFRKNTQAQIEPGHEQVDTILVPFTVIMKITDLFDTDDLLPIFNQQVKISLQRSALNDISIQCAHEGFTVELYDTPYFQLNIFQYLLDPANSTALMNIYSQPKSVVFSTKQYVFQTVTNTGHSSQCTINSPTGLLFGAKFLMMYLAKSNTTSNMCPVLKGYNGTAGNTDAAFEKNQGILDEIISSNNYTLKRRLIDKFHASRFPSLYMGPHCALQLAYNTLNINCDNYTVLYDDITPLKQDIKKSNLKEEVSTQPQNYIDVNFNKLGDSADVCKVYYNRIYHEYVESCKHTGTVPISREEYLNCYPVVMAELSDFSKISTNSFLNITFNNYSTTKYGGGEIEKKYMTPYSPDGKARDQLMIICYGLRALQMSNGYARLMEVDNTITNSMDDVLSTSTA